MLLLLKASDVKKTQALYDWSVKFHTWSCLISLNYSTESDVYCCTSALKRYAFYYYSINILRKYKYMFWIK